MEIERKFLIGKENLPADFYDAPRKEFVQGYLCTSPVVRVRKEAEEFILTYKGSGFLSREEYNLPMSEEGFYHLLKKCDGHVIEKTRYFYPLEGGYTAEVDFFSGEFAPLIIGEVEFSGESEAAAFAPPPWFGEEVTYDSAYHNSTMSREGRPHKV